MDSEESEPLPLKPGTPVSGERVQKLVDEIYAQPKEIARKTGALMQ